MENKKYTNIVIGTIIILGFVIGIYFYSSNKGGIDIKSGEDSLISTIQFSKTPTRSIPDGWLEYQNNQYNFSLFYPEGMVVNKFDEGAGASTITFENIEKGVGFQIFIVPYGGTQIDEGRFLRDVPSGIRQNPSELYIDGVLANSFYSKNLGLGDTWEVWFIYKGFLYEVTTFREQSDWLSQIMKTWSLL